MDRFFSRFLLLAVIATFTLVQQQEAVAADGEEQNFDNYDTILNQLNKDARSTSRLTADAGPSPFDDVWIHAGVGLAGFFQEVTFDDGSSAHLNQRGIQASLGIDLFSEHWLAEGTARSFGETGDSSVRSAVQEFEMRVIYKDRLARRMNVKVGAGLSGRYLTLKKFGVAPIEYSTPMSIATAGLEMYFGDRFSIGVDLNGRFAMIGETLDKGSMDATFRMDTHF